MPPTIKKIIWVIQKAKESAQECIAESPIDVLDAILGWVKKNPKTCALIFCGTLFIFVPLAVGLEPTRVIAGSLAAAWRLGIETVVPVSQFVTRQSLARTGAVMGLGLGAGLIGFRGFLKFLEGYIPQASVPPEDFDAAWRKHAGDSGPSPHSMEEGFDKEMDFLTPTDADICAEAFTVVKMQEYLSYSIR